MPVAGVQEKVGVVLILVAAFVGDDRVAAATVEEQELQAPPEQAWPEVQAWLQEPQLLVSVWVLTQELLQLVRPDAQEVVQVLLEQTWPEVQVCPQDPQLAASLVKLTQVVPQRVWGEVQVVVLQLAPAAVQPSVLLPDPETETQVLLVPHPK